MNDILVRLITFFGEQKKKKNWCLDFWCIKMGRLEHPVRLGGRGSPCGRKNGESRKERVKREEEIVLSVYFSFLISIEWRRLSVGLSERSRFSPYNLRIVAIVGTHRVSVRKPVQATV